MVAALMFVAGGVVGGALALLYAPQSGRKTRQNIGRTAKRVRHRAEKFADEVRDKVNDVVESVEEQTEELMHQGKELATEAKEEVIKVLEDGERLLAAQRKRLKTIFS
jgi:gas vesicle protein